MRYKEKKYTMIGIGCVLIVLGLAAGWRLGLTRSGASGKALEQMRQSDFADRNYKFIDPLLGCNAVVKKDLSEFTALKSGLNQVIAGKLASGQADQISVYFDTRDGNWLSINPEEKYSPASLMKVPVAIAWLKKGESRPEVLSQKITYDGRFNGNIGQYFNPEKTLAVGSAYVVDDLLSRMLTYSDNNSYLLLIGNIDESLLNEVASDLGVKIPPPTNGEVGDFITVKQYANFFRVLYNASYLNRDMSEKLLTNLSHNGFPGGLAAGLPPTVTIAEKFGEHSLAGYDIDDPANEKELHDCGIIYYPDHPYLLCVMTKGRNFDKLTKTISDISGVAYDFINVDQKTMDK